MYDDYRRTFPFKLIGPIIDAEQLSAGNQLDRQDLSTASRARQGIIGACAFPKKKERERVTMFERIIGLTLRVSVRRDARTMTRTILQDHSLEIIELICFVDLSNVPGTGASQHPFKYRFRYLIRCFRLTTVTALTFESTSLCVGRWTSLVHLRRARYQPVRRKSRCQS